MVDDEDSELGALMLEGGLVLGKRKKMSEILLVSSCAVYTYIV